MVAVQHLVVGSNPEGNNRTEVPYLTSIGVTPSVFPGHSHWVRTEINFPKILIGFLSCVTPCLGVPASPK